MTCCCLFSLSSSLHCSFDSRWKNPSSQSDVLLLSAAKTLCVQQLGEERAQVGTDPPWSQTSKDSSHGSPHRTLAAALGSEVCRCRGHRAKSSVYLQGAKDIKKKKEITPPSKLTGACPSAEWHRSFPRRCADSAPQHSSLMSPQQMNSLSYLPVPLFTHRAPSPPGSNTQQTHGALDANSLCSSVTTLAAFTH